MHGYHWTVFDLGGLGFGRSFPVTDEVFQSTGCYQTNFQKWPSRAMHKPQVIGEFVNVRRIWLFIRCRHISSPEH